VKVKVTIFPIIFAKHNYKFHFMLQILKELAKRFCLVVSLTFTTTLQFQLMIQNACLWLAGGAPASALCGVACTPTLPQQLLQEHDNHF
jgi:hypothetical protein